MRVVNEISISRGKVLIDGEEWGDDELICGFNYNAREDFHIMTIYKYKLESKGIVKVINNDVVIEEVVFGVECPR